MSDEIFSRPRRRLNRARALRATSDSRWLSLRMAEELADRLSYMSLQARHILVIGDGADVATAAFPDAAIYRMDLAPSDGVDFVGEEDRLPIADNAVDLVIAIGNLDSVHDLPGALLLIRRALRPGGLFLGAMLGGGSVASLRAKVAEREAAAGKGGAARFHPQVDVRAAGDLLFRAGFSTPVADLDLVNVRYSRMTNLLADVRAISGNALPAVRPLSGAVGRSLLKEGDFEDQFGILYLTGWAPAPGEARPAGPVKGAY